MKLFYRFAIGLYQKYISPRKGYRCAHSVLHGDKGCSGAVLDILLEKGAVRGASDIRARFKACKDACQVIKEKQKKKKKDRFDCDCCDPTPSCNPAPNCDCDPCDAFDIDVCDC